jgi:GNAT superfamily N-acetyltransferase
MTDGPSPDDVTFDFDFLGWSAEEPTLALDYRHFAYAGKFVLPGTGKAAVRTPSVSKARPPDDDRPAPAVSDLDDDVLAAVSFDVDRTDPDVLVIRYVTVRRDRRGEGLGPALVTFLLDRASGRYHRVRIGVNNPYAYEALYRAGFDYTGRTSGLAELVLERDLTGDSTDADGTYRAGLDEFTRRELNEAQRAFVERKRERGPPKRN